MDTLGLLAAVKHKKHNFDPRKIAPIGSRAAITGAPRTGKSSLLLASAIESGEPFLYLDLEDDRVSIEQINAELGAYLSANSTRLLAIDNYDDRLALNLSIDTIWLTQRKPRQIEGFTPQTLFALDFEEYMAHSGKDDPRLRFDDFLRTGGLIELSRLDETERIRKAQEILRILCDAPQKKAIFAWFLLRGANALTPHQAYEALKSKIAVSKDTLYGYIQSLIDAQALFVAPKLGATGAPRKFYPYDHALREAISFDRALFKTFETMIALELIKRKKTLNYADGIDLFVAQEDRAIIVAPFADKERLNDRLKNVKIKAKKIEFITMGFAAKIADRAEAIPFWEWALMEGE
jgi:predicted AAA+ superfamily ATPase